MECGCFQNSKAQGDGVAAGARRRWGGWEVCVWSQRYGQQAESGTVDCPGSRCSDVDAHGAVCACVCLQSEHSTFSWR